MTLDFKKLIKNSLVKQLTIQHVDIPDRSVQIFKRDELVTCQKITLRLQEIFGQNFMLDGDYWIFFSSSGSTQDFTKDFAEETLFKCINAALGESANNMNESDIKLFSFSSDPVPPPAEGDKAEEPDMGGETDADDANAAAIDDVMSDGEEGQEELDESVEEPQTGEKFAFIKITMK